MKIMQKGYICNQTSISIRDQKKKGQYILLDLILKFVFDKVWGNFYLVLVLKF